MEILHNMSGGIVGFNVNGSITYCNNWRTNATSISKAFGGIVGFNKVRLL